MVESKSKLMLLRFTRLWVALGIVVALWAISSVQDAGSRVWVRPVGTPPGPVRILQFYASVGTLTPGEKAQLCYGVENARSVRISPDMQGVYPSINHCLEIVPEHTTHYTILAEGFDGAVATRSFTLPVKAVPAGKRMLVNYAEL
jgi:hypothetical protein